MVSQARPGCESYPEISYETGHGISQCEQLPSRAKADLRRCGLLAEGPGFGGDDEHSDLRGGGKIAVTTSCGGQWTRREIVRFGAGQFFFRICSAPWFSRIADGYAPPAVERNHQPT